jgi:hypothetical protein
MPKPKPKRTFRINITPEKDPRALRVSMRYGNHWWRATIRDERPWDAIGIMALTSKPAIFMEYFTKAVAAGEAYEKGGLRKPWVKKSVKEKVDE